MKSIVNRYAGRIGIFAGVLLLVVVQPSTAFRCGTELISIGDDKWEVRQLCGEPDHVNVWQEERIFRDFSSYRSDIEPDRNREPFLVKQQVVVERWTYNRGSHRLVRHLLFENGRLVEIATGEHGD
jgi:hypothetical protein